MQLGLLTAPFPDLTLDAVADWSAANGYTALEVACWPQMEGPVRRYAGTSHIRVDGLTEGEGQDIKGRLAEKGVTISALGYYPNPLHPDAGQRQEALDHLKKVISAAAKMGLGVNTFCGADPKLTVEENWETAKKVWPDLIAQARAEGTAIAFENCPMIFSYDEWPSGNNIAYSPRVWRWILDEWDGAVGMNFDPSHLVYQMIDMGRFIREFGAHFHHVHAKDLMIDRDGLYERGILSEGIGWQVPRMPGLGEVDWPLFFSMLTHVGYDGPVVVEHEDRRFEKDEDAIKRGFLLARDVLTPYIK